MTTERQSNLRPLSPFLKEKAKTELFEDESTRLQAIDDLIAAYKKAYPDLPLKREDDLFIIRFLRARKYDHERALTILHNFHKFLKDHPEMDYVASKEEYLEIAKAQLVGVMKGKAKSGATIVYLQASGMDPDKITGDGMQKGFGFMWDNILEDEASQICGVVMVEDFKDFSLSKAKKFQKQQPTGDSDMYYFLQQCLPLRLKAILFVNQPWWASLFIAVAKVFMSQKLKSRFFYYGSDFEKLEEFISMKVLPTKIGGEVDYDAQSSLEAFHHWETRELVDI